MNYIPSGQYFRQHFPEKHHPFVQLWEKLKQYTLQTLFLTQMSQENQLESSLTHDGYKGCEHDQMLVGCLPLSVHYSQLIVIKGQLRVVNLTNYVNFHSRNFAEYLQ